jgi:hypothetical protein
MTSLSVNACSFASDKDGRSGTSATFNRNEDGQLTPARRHAFRRISQPPGPRAVFAPWP